MIRQVIIATISVFFLLLASSAPEAATVVKGNGKGKPVAAPSTPTRAPKFVDGQVLVGFSAGITPQARADAHRQVGGRLIRTLRQLNVDVVAVAAGAVPVSVEAYRRNPNVRFAEPNYARRLTLPNEGSESWPYSFPPTTISFMNEQWGLHNTGQPLFYDQFTGELGALKGVPDADIDFSEAWDRLTGQAIDQSIVIAVLDSGVDCAHEDLNGKCIHQQNFGPSVYGQADILGHGTHVAATAAAKTNNGLGTAGVGWNAKVADLKVCYEEIDELLGFVFGYCNDADIAAGLSFAADQGYQIASMSLAGPEQSSTLNAAVDYAVAQGVLIVAGAGNAYTQDPMYPAGHPSVVAVGATDYFDNLASFSSFGKSWVHLLAPGVNILSALSTEACGVANCYGWNSGTSMATPHVSGAAALIWGRMKALGRPVSNTVVRDILKNSADSAGALGQNFRAWVERGRLNLNNAIVLAETGTPPPSGDTTPPVISWLTSRITGKNGSFEITWTTDEPATSDVLLGSTWFTDANLTTSHRRSFRGTKGATYNYTVRSTDAAGNSAMASGIHNN